VTTIIIVELLSSFNQNTVLILLFKYSSVSQYFCKTSMLLAFQVITFVNNSIWMNFDAWSLRHVLRHFSNDFAAIWKLHLTFPTGVTIFELSFDDIAFARRVLTLAIVFAIVKHTFIQPTYLCLHHPLPMKSMILELAFVPRVVAIRAHSFDHVIHFKYPLEDTAILIIQSSFSIEKPVFKVSFILVTLPFICSEMHFAIHPCCF